MANRASPPVPAGLKWCHGCTTALSVERFAVRSCRGRMVQQSRCRPCLHKQKQAQRVAGRERHAFWEEREAKRRKTSPVPVRLPEELDNGPLPLC